MAYDVVILNGRKDGSSMPLMEYIYPSCAIKEWFINDLNRTPESNHNFLSEVLGASVAVVFLDPCITSETTYYFKLKEVCRSCKNTTTVFIEMKDLKEIIEKVKELRLRSFLTEKEI